MERKIGEIFEYNGEWYQFVEENRDICKDCVFHQSKIKCTNPDEDARCSKWHREDGKNGHFVRLLPIGDVYEQGGARWQQYKCVDKPNTEDKRVYISHTDSEVGLIVSIRLSSNDMENNEKHSNFENIGKNLKEFNLEAAKAGKPVCTRDGRKARIICFDAKNDPQRPIIALVENNSNELLYEYTIEGKDRFSYISTTGTSDLMMLPEVKWKDEEPRELVLKPIKEE